MIQNLILKNAKSALGISFLVGVFSPMAINYINSLKTGNQTKDKDNKLYVGIELGGTNYSVGIGLPNYNQNGQLISFTLKKNIFTGRTDTNCQKTIQQIIDYLGDTQYYFIGICSFGPLCLDTKNQHYGQITTTPKQSWKNFPILKKIKERTKALNYGFDTDVNGPAYAQFTFGNHGVKQSLIYVTVGSGVGIGVISNGKTIHGLVHPQGGHIIVRRHPNQQKQFQGVCPFHKDCLQGFVTNRSIASRLKIDIHSLHTVHDNHQIWKFIGFYLAQLCINVTLILSPEVIVIGGGIMNRKIIFKHIHQEFYGMLNNYINHQKLKKQNLKNYIKEPKIQNVGIIGGMLLTPIQNKLI